MPVTTFNFTTGPATLPDVAEMSYNGCRFSPLFETSCAGVAVKDAAQRTVKYMEYTLTADGYVTLPAGETSVAGTISNLRTLLSAQGGALVYQGRGCDLVVNAGRALIEVGTSRTTDVAWGPVPEVLEFQPLGGGLSAKVRWQCKVRIPEVTRPPNGPGLLQFNYETVVSYGDDYHSALSIRGTLEIPLTRPTQPTRTLTRTADDLRDVIDSRIMSGMDLSRFRPVRRNISLSRDKRTLEFDFQFEEKPYMDLPPDCVLARGTYNVRPAQSGMGLVRWMCSLNATYTVRADRPWRTAWVAFLALLRLRMINSVAGYVPTLTAGAATTAARLRAALAAGREVSAATPPAAGPGATGLSLLTQINNRLGGLGVARLASRLAWLCDFSISEGVYLDSKTVTFSASWRITTTFSHILLASGLWKKLPETDAAGFNLWATTTRQVSGAESWLANHADPRGDIIVDFGSDSI